MSTNITVDVAMVAETCWDCGTTFAMEWRWQQLCANSGKSFYCPKGCKLTYEEGALKLLEKKLAREEAYHDQTRAELKDTEHRRRAEKAAKTRLKQKIQNGQCPCCRRHFANVRGHMKRQHPEFVEESR